VEETNPKHLHFQKLEEEVAECVCLKRKIGLPVTCETINIKHVNLLKHTSHGIISIPAWVDVSI
jgi:hypothetical protein